MLRELIIPCSVLAIVASMLLPLPPAMIDLLVVTNLVLALVLFLSSLYLSDPLRLSALPTMLLLATLFRLSLNISTTRLILSAGEGGRVIEAFGSTVIGGNAFVGAIIFLVITLVQFLVIAKGAERVAEVCARFTLDALPGRQMSIDADVRAGLIDFQTARVKRTELQTESRFYGALDGAMKFVKGDAIAGLCITAINILGGLAVGIVLVGLDIGACVSKYTLLTIGDGLAAQIPALLNALAAGMVITRVSRGDGASLSQEVLGQFFQESKARFLVAVLVSVLGFLPGLPAWPFLGSAAFILLGGAMFGGRQQEQTQAEKREVYQPRSPAVIAIELPAQFRQFDRDGTVCANLESFTQRQAFNRFGLILAPPAVAVVEELQEKFLVRVRGIIVLERTLGDPQTQLEIIHASLEELLEARVQDLVDDILTRRMLDWFDRESPELVSTVVPGIVSVTQLSVLLRELVREGITVKNFDLILQCIAESGAKAATDRDLLEEVRIALKRVISDALAREGVIRGYLLDPGLDLKIMRIEKENQPLDAELLEQIGEALPVQESDSATTTVLVTSRASRRLVRDCLTRLGKRVHVMAHEEISEDVFFDCIGCVGRTRQTETSAQLTRIAA